jgi:putative hemolysin
VLGLYIEILTVAVLTLVNGLLAMSELAVVSSRPARLKVLSDKGSRRARMALNLAENPGRFLSTVQIGITLVGVLSGAFSGATLGLRLTQWLQEQGLSTAIAEGLGVGSVVVAITYASLIIGELVPKQIALRDPEKVACRVAPAMTILSKVSAPLVWLLDASGRIVLKILGQKTKNSEGVTEEEVKSIIAEAESAGVLEKEEKNMISGVMRFADRSAKALMTPRRDVEMIDLNDSKQEILQQIRGTRRSRLPVQGNDADSILGVIFVKDIIEPLSMNQDIDIESFAMIAPIVTDNANALDVLKAIRASTIHMALVFDEYGHFEGVITSGDILEAITGVFQEEGDHEPSHVQRQDGSWLVSGWMPIDEFADHIGGPVDPNADYETLAGFVLNTLNRLPEVGETFTIEGWIFEVVDIDGRRIDKILVTPKPIE